MSITWRTKAALTQSHFLEQNSYFLNTLRAPYFLHAHTRGLWLYGGTLFSLFLFLSLTHPCFPSHHLPWTGAQENTVPTVPDLQTPDAEDERVSAEKHARLLGCAEQIICTTGLCPAAPLTHPPSLPLTHTCVLGVCWTIDSWLWLHRIFSVCVCMSVAKERPGRFPLFVPNVWSHLSVKQEGLGSPSPLGLFRYFRELHFSLCGCLDLGSSPTEGFFKWRSRGWGCRAHLLQPWGPSIINGATALVTPQIFRPGRSFASGLVL